QAVDHFQDQLRRRMGAGMAVGHDLDSNGFAWLDKNSPSFDRIRCARKLHETSAECRPDRRAVSPSAAFQGGVTDLDHPSRVRSGDTKCSTLAKGLRPTGTLLGADGRRPQEGDRGRSKKLAAMDAAMKTFFAHVKSPLVRTSVPITPIPRYDSRALRV